MTNEELVLKYQNGNNNALKELIKQNEGIIYKLVKTYNVKNDKIIDKDDLFQSGAMGLIIAAKKYDFDNPMKAQFITYAIHYIRRYINNCVFGRGDKEKANSDLNKNCTSLNTPTKTDDTIEIQDTIKCDDYSYENVDEKLFIEQLHKDLETLMNEKLTLKEREILKLHYGWNNIKLMNYESIGEIFGMTAQKIRNDNEKALNKLRRTSWIQKNRIMFITNGYLEDNHYKNLGIKRKDLALC